MARLTAAIVVLALVVAAQQKPNFSGRWVIISPKQGAGDEQTVKHDDKTLTTEHAGEGPEHRMSYQLDGVERRLALPSHGAEITIMAKAMWEGDKVVITGNISYPNGIKTQTKEVWSLDVLGRLVVDYTETGPTGPPETTKVIYAKKQ